MANKGSGNAKYIIIIAIIIAALAFFVANQKKEPAPLSERVENAAEKISDGVTEAGRELDGDRTVGEKIGDAVEDAGTAIERTGDDIKDAVSE
jgi:hypothetical protein